MLALIQFVCLFLLFNGIPGELEEKSKEPVVSVFTVATENNHGLQRYLRSAKVYNINVEVIGMDEEWKGGDMSGYGGGQKVRLLKNRLKALEPLPDRERIILFTDSYDVIFLGDLNEIVTRFRNMFVRVLFSAEPFCWPDPTLAAEYHKYGKPNTYLNSGGFIGYYSDIMEILNFEECQNTDDDQLYYTRVYLDEEYRTKYEITLDESSVIFQTLNGVSSEVKLVTNSEEDKFPYIINAYNKRPLILHGNGPSKSMLNHLSNYLAKAWSVSDGCLLCLEKRIPLKENSLPTILMAVFIIQPTPFMEEFIDQIYSFDYPKNKIHLFIYNQIKFHQAQVQLFYDDHSKEYLSVAKIDPSDLVPEGEARNRAMDMCINSACDYLFSIDSLSRVKPSTIRYLLATGYDIVAPMLVRNGHSWSNFWGAVSKTGYYARSSDYLDIVDNKIKGIWNVPFITNCYMMNITLLRGKGAKEISYLKNGVDPDMVFCASLRKKGIMMHVSNEKELGHLVNPEKFDIKRTNPDVYEVIENNLEWESRYLSKEYHINLVTGKVHAMPCPDVYWFPIMSDRFCKEWIEIMEAYGKWSDGSNNDKRLEGGYEAVPTRDIHMKQVGLEKQWLYILKEYVRPLQELVFTGYYHNPPVSLMNFVVRYRPDEQPSLRPHHDSSTYTINIALNTPHEDYEGGGCHFIRYNCSVRDTKRGWMLMHPGRLTHFHEGLRVTKGTRYIMISFIDP